MDDIDPRAAKLLGDLLALALADNEPQAEAALAALRRRAAAEGVSGGAMKQAVQRVLHGLGEGPASRTESRAESRALDEVHQLRGLLDDLRRELAETRLARRQAEGALARSERMRAELAETARGPGWGPRGGLLVALLVGVVLAGVGAMGVLRLRAEQGDAGLDRVARARLADDLRGCFLASSNSLAGTPFPLHVQVQLDADGRIIAAQWARDQAEKVVDLGQRVYGEMVVRTFAGGSCGALVLPASLRGRPARLDLLLPQ